MIRNLERGITTDSCNTNMGRGLGFSDAPNFENNVDSWPRTLASGARSLRLGSAATSACVSRYGAQDMVGNVRQWAAETVYSNSIRSNENPTNPDFISTVYLPANAWRNDQSFSVKIILPLGIPVNNTNETSNQSHAVFSLPVNDFRENTFYVNSQINFKGLQFGGGWNASPGQPGNDGEIAGRFFMRVKDGTGAGLGFRCGVEIPEPAQNP